MHGSLPPSDRNCFVLLGVSKTRFYVLLKQKKSIVLYFLLFVFQTVGCLGNGLKVQLPLRISLCHGLQMMPVSWLFEHLFWVDFSAFNTLCIWLEMWRCVAKHYILYTVTSKCAYSAQCLCSSQLWLKRWQRDRASQSQPEQWAQQARPGPATLWPHAGLNSLN